MGDRIGAETLFQALKVAKLSFRRSFWCPNIVSATVLSPLSSNGFRDQVTASSSRRTRRDRRPSTLVRTSSKEDFFKDLETTPSMLLGLIGLVQGGPLG